MLGYFNRTHAVQDGSWETFRALFHLEIALIVFSILCILFWFYIILTASNIHPNVRLINAFYFAEYPFQLVAWVIQPIIICSESFDDSNKFSNKLFTYCGCVRIIGMFYAFSASPALVIERSFATIMLENYERSPNRHIGISIVTIQIFISVAVGIHFNWAKNTVWHTVIAIIVNLLAFCLNNINAKINFNYSQQMKQVHYSLSQRFQITENIKSAKMFNKIVWSIGFFNVVVNICLIADNYDIPLTLKNIASVACDFSILLYGLIVPIVYFSQTKSWKRRVREILKRNCEPRVSPERNDFAQEITSHAPRGEAHKYFEMLKEQWG